MPEPNANKQPPDGNQAPPGGGLKPAVRLPVSDKLMEVGTTARFMWKVHGFSRRKQEAASGHTLMIDSDPFYRFGRKMMIRFYPYGHKTGRSTHASIFLKMEDGEFDTVLSWPFKVGVNLKIMDVTGDKRHFNRYLQRELHSQSSLPNPSTYLEDVSHSHVEQITVTTTGYPVEDPKCAAGSSEFVKHRDLECYLKDDTLYMEITVMPA